MNLHEINMPASTIEDAISGRTHPNSKINSRNLFRLHPLERQLSLPIVSIDEMSYDFQEDFPHLEYVGAKLLGRYIDLAPWVGKSYSPHISILFQSPNMKHFGQLQLNVVDLSLNLEAGDQNILREQMREIAEGFYSNLAHNMSVEYSHRVEKLRLRGQE